MAELNPQIQKHLRTIAKSPELIPTLVCLKANYKSTVKYKITRGLLDLHKSIAGQQVLTIFKSGLLVIGSEADLESSRRLHASYKRLHDRKNDDKMNVRPNAKKIVAGGNP
jgi:hypothetical protein